MTDRSLILLLAAALGESRKASMPMIFRSRDPDQPRPVIVPH
jgi:hypothetical protein